MWSDIPLGLWDLSSRNQKDPRWLDAVQKDLHCGMCTAYNCCSHWSGTGRTCTASLWSSWELLWCSCRRFSLSRSISRSYCLGTNTMPLQNSKAPSLQDLDYLLLARDFQVNVGFAEVLPRGTWIIVANYTKRLKESYCVDLTPCHIHSHFTFISGGIE